MAGAATLQFKEVIGRGGFGTVYRAVLATSGGFRKEVAVKILHEQWAHDPSMAPRIRDEARVLGLIRHRALPSVDGLFWVEGRPSLVTEYVEGATLTELYQGGDRLPPGVALEVCAEVAAALHAALSREGPDGRPLRLVHRDVKPSNIQITRAGEVKLLDFGIAHADFAARESETTGHLLGSLRYMSPERLDLETGPEGDIYSLGIMLVESMTGLRFKKTSADTTRHAAFVAAVLGAVEQQKGDPSPALLVPLLRDLLAYEPEARPTARALERHCRDLRRTMPGDLLPEWADPAVEAAIARRQPRQEPEGVEPLVGRTVPALPTPDGVEPDAIVPSVALARRAGLGLGVLVTVTVFLLTTLIGLGIAWGLRGLLDRPAEEPLAVVVPLPDPLPEPKPLPEPEPEPEPRPVAAPVPVPQPVPPPAPPPAPRSSGAVTASAFAAWVDQNADWSRERAIERRRASEAYLQGWDAGVPPGWAVHVSWYAAEAYCRSRGGLIPIDDSPTEWAEGSAPFHEWRISDGGPAWRRFDGATSTAVLRTEANAFIGFRCVR